MENLTSQPYNDRTLMLCNQIANKLRSKITEFSGYVSKNLDKTARRFVSEALYGIMASQSVMLTEIGRNLETRVPLKKIEERFCRQLKKTRDLGASPPASARRCRMPDDASPIGHY